MSPEANTGVGEPTAEAMTQSEAGAALAEQALGEKMDRAQAEHMTKQLPGSPGARIPQTDDPPSYLPDQPPSAPVRTIEEELASDMEPTAEGDSGLTSHPTASEVEETTGTPIKQPWDPGPLIQMDMPAAVWAVKWIGQGFLDANNTTVGEIENTERIIAPTARDALDIWRVRADSGTLVSACGKHFGNPKAVDAHCAGWASLPMFQNDAG